MKNLVYLISAMLLATSCASNLPLVDSTDLSTARVGHPEFHKVRFQTVPDPDKKLECGLPAAGTIKGYCNLVGEIIPEESPFTIWHWHWDPNSPDRKLVESIEGTVTGNNNNTYYYTGIVNYDVKKESLTGTMYINGGIGKLDGITGECYMKGNFRDGISMWSAQGSYAMRKGSQKNELPEGTRLSSY
jgi:hypothetical protein